MLHGKSRSVQLMGSIAQIGLSPPTPPIDQTMKAVLIAISIAIAYVAFRGYRRNASRPMLFIAVGFVLAIALPGTLQYLLWVLTVGFQIQLPVDMIYIFVFMQGCQLLGMASILYALLMQ